MELAERIGFIGAGSMAEALVRGMLVGGVAAADRVMVTNRSNRERLASLAWSLGVEVTPDKARLCSLCDVLVLAVKPKDVAEALAETAPYLRPGQTLISVAAGVPLAFLEAYVPRGVGVIRAMPNTSCLVQESATAFSTGRDVTPAGDRAAREIFSSVGRVLPVREEDLDAVTGLSGSGPAYVYLMIEALAEAGTASGLPRGLSLDLAVQTVFGAAKMVRDTGEDPGRLRSRVMSPGGTTVAALEVLDRMGFSRALGDAVRRAAERSRELGGPFRLAQDSTPLTEGSARVVPD